MNASNASIQIEIDNNNNRSSALSTSTAYAESLKLILQHVADFHLTVVEIISEKYNISVDEMMKAVTSDPRYANMVVNPEIHRLTSLNQSQQQSVVEIPLPTPVTKKVTEKKIRIKPKNTLLSASAMTTLC
jgi:hypothetical protein